MERRRRGEGRSRYVLDAAAFLNSSFLPEGALYTTPSVLSEIKSERRFLIPEDIRVEAPERAFVERIRRIAEHTGDDYWLSEADVDILALALQVGGTLITDDFHVQNVAAHAGIPFSGITAEIREKCVWRRVCPVCGREYHPKKKVCPVCGARLTPPRRIRCT